VVEDLREEKPGFVIADTTGDSGGFTLSLLVKYEVRDCFRLGRGRWAIDERSSEHRQRKVRPCSVASVRRLLGPGFLPSSSSRWGSMMPSLLELS